MEQLTLKNINNYLNTNIYSCLETSGSNAIKLFTSVIYECSWKARVFVPWQDFPA